MEKGMPNMTDQHEVSKLDVEEEQEQRRKASRSIWLCNWRGV